MEESWILNSILRILKALVLTALVLGTIGFALTMMLHELNQHVWTFDTQVRYAHRDPGPERERSRVLR